MTDAVIASRLKTALLAVLPASRCAFANERFVPPNDERAWFEIDFIPGEPTPAGLGTEAQNRWVGLMQITICIPKGVGNGEAVTIYEMLATTFARGVVVDGCLS